MTTFHEGLLIAFTTIVLTLFARWAWDRWLSETSRVTEQRCKDNQLLCSQNIAAKIAELNVQLMCGDTNFGEIKTYQIKTSHTLKLILMTLSELCEVGDGCKDSTKEDLRQEIMK